MRRKKDEKERVKEDVMKRTYHICLSAGDEILFRDSNDYNRGFNCFALALHKTNSTGLVEVFMSNHCHLLLQSDSPRDFMFNFRMQYSMYFNRKYERHGNVGEKQYFTMEVVGHYHTLAAASYILRNPLHHGVAPIPYAYPHSTSNSIFIKEMGKRFENEIIPRKHYHRFLGKNAQYPDRYKMNRDGLFLRESVLDIPQIEHLYSTPRTYNYYMSRKSTEEWEAEQRKDSNEHKAINIASIESGIKTESIEKMQIFENGKGNYRKITDIELCTEIDKILVPATGKSSIYHLSPKEKQRIAEYLYKNHRGTVTQIQRCLAMI